MSRRLFTAIFSAALLVFCGVAHATDSDFDGLTDDFENAIGSDPNDADTDDDGWSDGREVLEEGTDWMLVDTDGDGVWDNVDSEPLLPPSGPYDGGSAISGAGWLTGTPDALSGESAFDGIGVHMHDGGFSLPITVFCEQAPGPDGSLTLLYDSRASSDLSFGKNMFSILDVTYSVDPGTSHFTSQRMSGVEFTAIWNSGSSSYSLPVDIQGELEQVDVDEYVLTLVNGVELHYAGGVLDKIQNRHGNTLDFSHNVNGQVTSYSDARSQTYSVAYYLTGRVKTVTKPDNSVWTFIYNDYGQLHRIEGPDTTQFPTGIDREFRYVTNSSDPSLQDNMTAVIDGMGNLALLIEYDSSDRVTRQFQNNWDLAWTFDYSAAASNKTTVTAPGGASRVWEWDATKLTRKKLEQKSDLDVRTSDPTSWDTAWTHDADGYLSTVTLPEGNGVKYTRNSVKLVTERRHKTDMTAADSASADLIHEWEYDSNKYYGATSYTSPGGEETTYTLNSKGQPTTITYPTITGETAGFTESYTYNSGDGSIATHTDACGAERNPFMFDVT